MKKLKAISIAILCLTVVLSSCQNTNSVAESEEPQVEESATITHSPRLINYEDFPGVWDFELYSGETLKSTVPSRRYTSFSYGKVDSSVVENYIQALKDNGFELEEGTDSNMVTLKSDEYKLEITNDNVFRIFVYTLNSSGIPITKGIEGYSDSTMPSKYDLRLSVDKLTEEHGYATVTLSVTNTSKYFSYSYIKVKGIFYNSEGEIITTDETYANSSSPLLPGESKRFKLYTDVGTGFRRCSAEIIDYTIG